MSVTQLNDFLELVRSFPLALKEPFFTIGQEKASYEKLARNFEVYCPELQRKISDANDGSQEHLPLRIGFIGGFNAGKSSIINSLLESDLLGVDVKPATARTTEIIYGPQLRLQKVLVDGETEEIGLDEFTKMSNHSFSEVEAQFKDVDSFRIEFPSEKLKKFSIIDTPGFFSTSDKDDELTLKRLQDMHLILWVFDIANSGQKQEIDLLQKLTSKKIIGILNKAEGKSPAARNKQKEDLTQAEPDFKEILFYSSSKVLKYQRERKNYLKGFEDLLTRIDATSRDNDVTISFTSRGYFFCDTPEKVYEWKVPKENDFTNYHRDLLYTIDVIREKEKDDLFLQNLEEKRRSLSDFASAIIGHMLFETEDIIEKVNREIRHLEELERNAYQNLEYEKEQLKIHLKPLADSLPDKAALTIWENLFQRRVDKGFFGDKNYFEKKPYPKKAEKDLQVIFYSFYEKGLVISNSILEKYEIKLPPHNSKLGRVIKGFINGIITNVVSTIFSNSFFPEKKFDMDQKMMVLIIIRETILHQELKKFFLDHNLERLDSAFHLAYESNRLRIVELNGHLVDLKELKEKIEMSLILQEDPINFKLTNQIA